MSSFDFEGSVFFRSSKPVASGPSGEAELFRINPNRIVHLCKITGWGTVYPGSLNLHVDKSVVNKLAQLRECYFEEPELIKYPDGTSTIPRKRGGYLYYCAELTDPDPSLTVLVRRAKQTPLQDRIEIYSPVKLIDAVELNEGDVVTVTVHDAT